MEVIRLHEDYHSLKHNKENQPFNGELGDSGTFMLETDGSLFGHLFGADEMRGKIYYTPVADFYEAIKDMTGCTAIRVPERWALDLIVML
jgi:hypothetical protein